MSTRRELIFGGFASENISRFILAGTLVTSCGAPAWPSGGIRSYGNTCPPQGRSYTPTAQERALGRQFRKDIVQAAQQFIGARFLQQGIKYDSDQSPEYAYTAEYAEEAWARHCYKDSVIERAVTRVRSDQYFTIANTYDVKGRVVETHISAIRIVGAIYKIDLRNLPGYPEAYRTHPHNVPGSEMEERGFGYIPPERLEAVARTVFNLPSAVSFQLAESCYTMPFSNNLYREPALIGTGYTADGRYLRIRITEGAGAMLLVTDPKMGQPTVPGLCNP